MLTISDLSVDFGKTRAVDSVDLTVPQGQTVAVLGPSGCGKSTLLRAVAGLETVASGTVSWDGHDITRQATHKRRFALMFQDGQLFTHLSVAANVGYPLRIRGEDKSTARPRVTELLGMVGLADYADRLPGTLSGGERQRVALARALAADPRLLLLDEPLSALDTSLRERLGSELRQIITDTQVTAVVVTHDRDEAFALADRLVLMRAGRVIQQGPIQDVWAAPIDAEAALFLGYAAVVGAEDAARLGWEGSEEALALRVDALTVTDQQPEEPDKSDKPSLIGTIIEARPTPGHWKMRVKIDGIGQLPAVAERRIEAGEPMTPVPGEVVGLRLHPARCASLKFSTLPKAI